MQIKRFEAKDMPQALKLVKRELGSEAVYSRPAVSQTKRGYGDLSKKEA